MAAKPGPVTVTRSVIDAKAGSAGIASTTGGCGAGAEAPPRATAAAARSNEKLVNRERYASPAGVAEASSGAPGSCPSWTSTRMKAKGPVAGERAAAGSGGAEREVALVTTAACSWSALRRGAIRRRCCWWCSSGVSMLVVVWRALRPVLRGGGEVRGDGPDAAETTGKAAGVCGGSMSVAETAREGHAIALATASAAARRRTAACWLMTVDGTLTRRMTVKFAVRGSTISERPLRAIASEEGFRGKRGDRQQEASRLVLSHHHSSRAASGWLRRQV